MEAKKRFKLYKSGKLWCISAMTFAAVAMGGFMANTTSAHADTTNAASQPTVQAVQASAQSQSVLLQSSSTKVNAAALVTTDQNQSSSASSAAVNNEVPVDTTTANNVRANDGHLDSYSVNKNDQGQTELNVAGWQATGQSNNARYRWIIVYDNTTHSEVTRQKAEPQQRPDVQRAYPHTANSLNSGYNLQITIPSNVLNHSLSIVSRYSNDPMHGEGQHTDYWSAPITFDESNRAYMDSLSGKDGQVTVTGWHASNAAAGMKYHYIIAFDQTEGREITRQLVADGDESRNDVANAYPTIANANVSGFKASFDLNSRFANHNIQFISRWTNDPAGNGSRTVDYWFNPVVKQNNGHLDSFNLSKGSLTVTGWHANDASIFETNHFLIIYDNTAHRQVAQAKVDTIASSDVANVYPNTITAGQSRFDYTFDGIRLAANHSYSVVSRYSDSATGNGGSGDYTDYWYPSVTLNQSAYHIDSWTPSNNSMKITGWVANDAAEDYQYGYVILLDDQGELGRQRINFIQRNDVASAYPGIYESDNSGFDVTIPYNHALTNNDHLQVVLRFTNDINGNGSQTADIWTNKVATNDGNFDAINIENNSFHVSGWHAADNINDKPYSYLIAMDANSNREITRWNITNNSKRGRNDVQKANPWIIDSQDSGFSFDASGINLTEHTGVYFIHRYTDDANGNGNYVDFYSNTISFVHYNMYANAINAFIINNHIGHANIEFRHILNFQGARSGILTGPGSDSTQYAYGKPVKIIVHETANPNDSLEGEINYESTTYENAFVHAFVDGDRIVEIAPTDRPSWGSVNGNPYGVQFEQVEVYGRDNFARELVNGAYYAAYNMKLYGMQPTFTSNSADGTLMSHHMVSMFLGGTDHTDPDGYWSNRAGSYFGTNYTMGDFFELVKYEYTQL